MGHDDGAGEEEAGSSPSSDPADITPVGGAPLTGDPDLSETTNAAPRGRRSVWPYVTVGFLVLASVGAAVLALNEEGGGSGDANAVLQQAVATTLQSKTASLSLSLTIGVDGGSSVTMFGKGVTNLTTNGTDLTLTFEIEGRTLTERMIVDGSTGYLNMGPEVSSIVPGKSWVSESGGDTSRQMIGSGGVFNDPATLVAVLRTEGTSVKPLGSSTLQGVPVDGYALHLGPAGIARSIHSQQLSAAARQSVTSTRFTRLDYQVFVDGSDHLRRVRASGAYAEDGLHTTVESTIDFSDFGKPVRVTPPPASEVVPMSQFDKILEQDGGNAQA